MNLAAAAARQTSAPDKSPSQPSSNGEGGIGTTIAGNEGDGEQRIIADCATRGAMRSRLRRGQKRRCKFTRPLTAKGMRDAHQLSVDAGLDVDPRRILEPLPARAANYRADRACTRARDRDDEDLCASGCCHRLNCRIGERISSVRGRTSTARRPVERADESRRRESCACWIRSRRATRRAPAATAI